MRVGLRIRKVQERTQRENWEGFAAFLVVEVDHPGGSRDVTELRLTPIEKATNDPAAAMITAQEWAKTKGYGDLAGDGWALAWYTERAGYIRADLTAE